MPKQISYKLSKWSALATIGGSILGLLLSGWAIGISIQASRSTTKI